MTSADPGTRLRRAASSVLVYIVLIVGAIVTLGPFALSVWTALKTPKQFATQSALTLPAPPVLDNFADLFSSALIDFGRSVWVTILYVGVVLVGQLLFSILAAYAFARLEFAGRDALFWVYIATLMVPPVVTVIPLYLMMATFDLRNTFWALVLPYVLGSPYAIFLLREYFRGIPQDIIDAARIDGAGTWRVLTRIVVPLSRPIIATLTVITVVTHWNNFLWPMIITSGGTWQVMTVATASMQGQYNGNWTLVMAATTLSMLPLIAVFVIFNRKIVDSIAITGFR
ncbi:MAG: carbohydrate ABC transporter permease [Microbacterium sp.]